MKISTKGRYGLKAIVEIASQNDSATTIKNISLRQSIPENYVEQILSPLKKKGFIKSIRGAQGGYVMNCAPENISVGDILRVLEGPLRPVDCSSEEKSCNNLNCKNCVTKSVWDKLYDNINNTVDAITIKDLVDDYKKL